MLSFRRNEGLRLLLPLTGRQGVEERGLMWIYLSPNKNGGLRIEGSAASEGRCRMRDKGRAEGFHP